MMRAASAQLVAGELARWSHRIRAEELDEFARLSGDVNPLHTEDEFARRHGFLGRVAHGMLLNAYVSRMLGTVLPGPGTLWLSQTTRFLQPAYVGDRIEVVVRITHAAPALRMIVLATSISNQREETLMTGEAKAMLLARDATVPWTDMVAIVTGGSRGIGAAVARALGARGAHVVVNYHEADAEAREVALAVDGAGGDAIAVAADVTNADDVGRLADTALDAFGRVDIVVNNATPPIDRKPFDELSWADVDRYWRCYVQAPFLLAQRLLPGMKERAFGRFVHVLTSAMWGTPPQNVSGYVAAKSGLWGLARSMAVELAPYGITVNAVSPSAVLTDQWTREPETGRRALALGVPMRRLAGADEVASAVLYFLGEQSAYVTGANLPVAGGAVM